MIFRLSTKLASKLKVVPAAALPIDTNRFADWSAHLFTADRRHYVIVTNTASLYSVLFHARGIGNEHEFIQQALRAL